MLDENELNLFTLNTKTIFSYPGDNEDDDRYYDECIEIEGEIFEKFEKYVYVKIFIDSNDEKFIKKYDEHIAEHNRNILDSYSFKLLCPCDIFIHPNFGCGDDNKENINDYEDGELPNYTIRVDFDIKCQSHMIYQYDSVWQPVSMMVHPIPTNTMSGIFRPIENIKPEYIGNLRVDLGCHNTDEIKILKKFDTTYQLMNIGLHPIYIERVPTLEELYTTKIRVSSCGM